MDSEFLKQRAAVCRYMAEKADPFIKQRLLRLASRYEDSLLKQPSQASIEARVAQGLKEIRPQ
jgi:hypothetical protein